jgi:hypothetical protein
MYPYPLTVEFKVDLPLPQGADPMLKAWELHLKREDGQDSPVHTLPTNLADGFIALVWKGSASLTFNDGNGVTTGIEGGPGIFFLDSVTEIGLAESAAELQLAVLGIRSSNSDGDEPNLEPRGRCKGAFLAMPEVPAGTPGLTLVVRRLDFTSDTEVPVAPKSELWRRPGFFLTSLDGPVANSSCAGSLAEDDPTPGQLELVALPIEEPMSFKRGQDISLTTAYVLDIYAAGDDPPRRDTTTEPGCQIRCWGI